MSMSSRDKADEGHLAKASEVPVGPESFPKRCKSVLSLYLSRN
jgi:hypothetical protein